jgi:hypothetical protein
MDTTGRHGSGPADGGVGQGEFDQAFRAVSVDHDGVQPDVDVVGCFDRPDQMGGHARREPAVHSTLAAST